MATLFSLGFAAPTPIQVPDDTRCRFDSRTYYQDWKDAGTGRTCIEVLEGPVFVFFFLPQLLEAWACQQMTGLCQFGAECFRILALDVLFMGCRVAGEPLG